MASLFGFFMVFGALTCVTLSSADETQAAVSRTISKRGIPWFSDSFSPLIAGPNLGIKHGSFGSSAGSWAYPPKPIGPSPNEVAQAISMAKQASANVMIAQQQVQAAKDNVLSQQRIAMDKETAAAILTQKSETAAAIQRSEAAAAAQGVVLAQQRYAAAKAAAAYQQKIAAAKEAEAAVALQRSAHAAAAEIQKTEYEATKFANLHRTGAAAAAHHLIATKDAALAPLTAGTNHVPNYDALHSWQGILSSANAAPWNPSNKFIMPDMSHSWS